jgi:hypothetical protein
MRSFFLQSELFSDEQRRSSAVSGAILTPGRRIWRGRWTFLAMGPTRIELEADAIEAIALRVADLLSGESRWDLIDAAMLARRLKVDRDWVYEHWQELGGIRLGDSDQGRLRFDPAKVRRKLGDGGGLAEGEGPDRRHRRSRPKRQTGEVESGKKPKRQAGAGTAPTRPQRGEGRALASRPDA